MKTKIVYIVVCDESNYYLEQALLSIYSLKINNPEARVSIITDNKSIEYIKRYNIISNIPLLDELIEIEVPLNYSKKQKSRYLKTNLRNLISGDYLFIDTDTIITGDLREIDNFSFHIGAVLDKHLPISTNLFGDDIKKFSKIFNWNLSKCDYYYNSGVMYVKDEPITKEFYKMWYKYWALGSEKYNINIDQPSLAKANEVEGFLIQEMDGTYNCQINENGLKYFYDAKILHYFASNIGVSQNSFKFAKNEIYKHLRDKGFCKEIIEMLNNPKRGFDDMCTIIAGRDCEINRMPISRIANRIGRKYPKLDKLLRYISLLRISGK